MSAATETGITPGHSKNIGAPNSIARYLSENDFGKNKFVVIEYVRGEIVMRAGQSTLAGAAEFAHPECSIVDVELCRIVPSPTGCGGSLTQTPMTSCGGTMESSCGLVRVFCNECRAKMNKKTQWMACGLCRGTGRQALYEDKWDCSNCDGKGGSYQE